MYDLRHHYFQKTTFDQFWSYAKEFIEEDVGTAVDDCRHSTVVHVAKAISICDLREKVVERCPPDIPVPSDEWICLQFSPACLTSHTTLRYKEGAFELSSPLRHSTELSNVLGDRVQHKPILFVYSDGGPDYRVTYISVKLALIALFRKWMLITSVRYELLCITHSEILLKGSCPSLILVSKLLPLHEKSCQRRWKQKPLSAIP